MKKSISFISIILAALLLSACGSPPSSTPNQTTEPVRKAVTTPVATLAPIKPVVPEDGLKSDGKIHVYIVGEGEKVLTPESSFIRYITYYPESDHLIINMNGKDYVFSNVDSGLWEDFKAAESKGKFYNSYIKEVSDYLINDYSSGEGDRIVVEYWDLIS